MTRVPNQPIDLHQIRFGVNYTPTANWYYAWDDWKADSIAKDLDDIVRLEADHIRLMLLWPSFHPNPRFVRSSCIERLRQLLSLARDRGLDVCVCLIQGWLSGYKFSPAFLKASGREFYIAEEAIEQTRRFAMSVVNEVADFDNILAIDLGNELNCAWSAEDDTESGDSWMRDVSSSLSSILPNVPIVNGVDHQPWFSPNTFSPQCLTEHQPIVPLHCWGKFTGAADRGGDYLSDQSIRLPATMTQLCRSYAGEFSKPVWIQEYGVSNLWQAPAKHADYLQASTVSAIDSGVSWLTWWCSHDLDPRFEFDELEYSLGLVGHDRKIKPHGRVFQELAQTYGGQNRRTPTQSLASPPQVHSVAQTWQWLESVPPC